MLVIELAARGADAGASFARGALWPTKKQARVRVACGDWTPGGSSFSRSTRHYIVGDISELAELANYLSAKSPALALRLRAAVAADDAAGDGGTAAATATRCANSLAGGVDALAPSRASVVSSLAAAAADAVLGAADGGAGAGGGMAAVVHAAANPAPARSRFASCDEVHAFLALAGVPNPKRVNACLKAGMLRGHVKCPPADGDVDAAKAWLDDIILEDDCICCGAPHTARVRDVLRQPTYAGFDYEDLSLIHI